MARYACSVAPSMPPNPASSISMTPARKWSSDQWRMAPVVPVRTGPLAYQISASPFPTTGSSGTRTDGAAAGDSPKVTANNTSGKSPESGGFTYAARGPTGLNASAGTPSAAVSGVVMGKRMASRGRHDTAHKKGPGVNPALNERSVFYLVRLS